MLEPSLSLKGKCVLVIGLGLSGQSAANFLLNRGALVVGVDRNPKIATTNENISNLCLKGMAFVQEDSFLSIKDFDLVVVSPGVPPTQIYYNQALEQGVEIIGEVELACREIRQICLGVTGTNGKTTVTLLTQHVLQAAGMKAIALGNVGIPLTSAVDKALEDKIEVFIIELSSFQLETLRMSFLDAAVILNITPDHLDRYPSMDHYAAAKIGIKKNIKPAGKLFVESKCLHNYQYILKNENCLTYGYSPEDYFYTDKQDVFCSGEKIFSLPSNYKGKHNHHLENIIASYALCSTLDISPNQFLSGVSSFRKPSHRLELVKTIRGIHYYDDSKGTNIDAVIRAVEDLEGSIILIAGGVDKGFPYLSWIDAFEGKVKAICAIGQSKEKIKNDLGNMIPVMLFTDFEEAVVYASNLAKAGENVLLSPGCSSFDMFKDYAHRGQEFQRIINAL